MAQENMYANAIGGVKLQIKEDEYERGIQILKQGGYVPTENRRESDVKFVPESMHIDKSVCPFCNSTNIGKKKEQNIVTDIVYFILAFISPLFKGTYKCYNCTQEWKYIKP